MKNQKMFQRKGLILLIWLIFTALLSFNVLAKDFIIQNNSKNVFIINGTLGNIILNPDYGKVGIGTSSPSEMLSVTGNISLNSTLNVVSGKVGIGTLSPATLLDVKGNVNISGNLSVDQNTFFINSDTRRVGIGTGTPNAKLVVVGGVNITGGYK